MAPEKTEQEGAEESAEAQGQNDEELNAQAEAGNEANAAYEVPTPIAAQPLPHLPDAAVLREQQEVGQGGLRPPAASMYDDVEIDEETGTRSSKPSEDMPEQDLPEQPATEARDKAELEQAQAEQEQAQESSPESSSTKRSSSRKSS